MGKKKHVSKKKLNREKSKESKNQLQMNILLLPFNTHTHTMEKWHKCFTHMNS